jgi:type IV pilus assembly protein PilM
VTLAKKVVTPPKGVLAFDIGTATRKLLGAIRRMTGKRMGRGVVTLDIDSATIKLLETGRGAVKKWASISLEPDKVGGEGVLEQPALGTMVKQLMASSGIKENKVIASASGLYSLSRILSVPNPPPGVTFQEAVLDMARERMPLSEDELYLSWQTIAVGESARQVFLVGLFRDALDGEVRSLRAVGINYRMLELRAMALTRAVNKEQALILNIELTSFDVIVVVHGIPEIMRPISWRPGDLTVEDKVENLVATLELTVDFYNSRYYDTPLDPATPLFITGQMSVDVSLVENLQARLRYPVESLAPPLECPADLPVSQYAVNIGLALKGTAPSESLRQGGYLPLDMNLLPEAYWPWRPSAKQLYASGLVIFAIGLLFPIFQVATEATFKTTALETTFTALNTKLELQKQEIKNREPLQKAINEYNTIANMGGYFTGDVVVINSEAEKLGVQVNSIAHASNEINIDCQADEGDYIAFRAYKMALEESGRFTTPVVPPEGYPYTWSGTIKVEPVGAKPSE